MYFSYEHWGPDSQFDALLGETIIKINGLSVLSNEVLGKADELIFDTLSGRQFKMFHSQDCCENVRLEDVDGDIQDLIGSPLLQAEVVSNADGPEPSDPESYTWTFYKLATIKGYITLRWLGESNGYYSERVSFVEGKPEPTA